MRISDWSSDVCSSDLGGRSSTLGPARPSGCPLRLAGGSGNSADDNAPAAAEWPQSSSPAPQNGARRCESSRQSPHIPKRGDGISELASARSEEHTSELQSLMRISYAVFCLQKKTNIHKTQ